MSKKEKAKSVFGRKSKLAKRTGAGLIIPARKYSIRSLQRKSVGARRLYTALADSSLPSEARATAAGVSYSQSGGKRKGAGRPDKSYKGYIPGVGKVPVKEQRKWMRQQQQLSKVRLTQGRISPEQYYAQLQQHAMQEEVPQMEEQYYEQARTPTRRVVVQQPVRRNILQAPNVMRGELRNVGGGSNYPTIESTQRPITAPGQEFYVDIDPMSGKQLMRRRIREKWHTGEAK